MQQRGTGQDGKVAKTPTFSFFLILHYFRARKSGKVQIGRPRVLRAEVERFA